MVEAVGVRPVPALPDTTRLAADPALHTLPGRNGTTVLLGGSPYKLLTLRPTAAAVVSALFSGKSVSEAASEAAVSVTAAGNVARRLLDNGMAEPTFTSPHRFSVSDLTAIIPVRNEAATIAETIRSLNLLGIQRVIVVDDGSTDETGAAATSARAQVLRNDSPQGPGAARMHAISEVTTSLVLFIDADATAPNEISTLLHAFDDPAVAMVAPRVESTPGNTVVARYEQVRSSLDLGPRRASVRPRSRVSYLPSAVLMARLDAVTELGGFDPALRYGEDVDLVWRTAAAGHVVRYEADVVAQHRPRPSLRSFCRQRFSYGSSAAPLDARHPGLVAPLQASGWSVLVWALALFGGPFGVAASVLTACGTAAALEPKLRAIEQPRSVAWSLTLRGHLGVGRQLASATWRAWLPLVAIGSLFSQRMRRTLFLAALVPVEEWITKRPSVDPASYIALRLIDDASYCAGVWKGCVVERSPRALLPYLANWPGNKKESNVE
jgi:mycofactocin glycosyltransferase